ncbi:MAG: single-stranded-DNA-specific exonuclease RecJ [bacterium]
MRFLFNSPSKWEDVSAEFGLLPPIAKVLVNRGCTSPIMIKKFISGSLNDIASPFLLPDIEEAISRVKRAFINREKVCLYGDYDVDGLSSIAILFKTMKGLGFDVSFYIPNRLIEGYGLNLKAVEGIRNKGVSLIITLDCGVSSVESIDYASKLGIDTIVIDHHNIPEILPKTVSIIDPKREDIRYPFPNLSGVGVTWQFARALASNMFQEDVNLEEVLDLVALGTIADIVPLIEENRVIVKNGISRLRFSPRIGIDALMRKVGLNEKFIDSEILSFTLIPRLNAAGRLGEADLAIELLLSSDERNALILAEKLEEKNRKRKGLVDQILNEIIQRLELKDIPPVILEYSEEWHSGVLGIASSRVVDMFNRPAFIGRKEGDLVRFSARSPEEIDIYDVLKDAKELFLRFGGHSHALGFTIKEEEIEDLKKILDKTIVEEKEETINIDAEISFDDITPSFINQLSLLEPYGMSNPRPIFITKDVEIVGENLNNNSRSIIIESRGKRYEVFGLEGVNSGDVIDLVYSIKRYGKMVAIGYILK